MTQPVVSDDDFRRARDERRREACLAARSLAYQAPDDIVRVVGVDLLALFFERMTKNLGGLGGEDLGQGPPEP